MGKHPLVLRRVILGGGLAVFPKRFGLGQRRGIQHPRFRIEQAVLAHIGGPERAECLVVQNIRRGRAAGFGFLPFARVLSDQLQRERMRPTVVEIHDPGLLADEPSGCFETVHQAHSVGLFERIHEGNPRRRGAGTAIVRRILGHL